MSETAKIRYIAKFFCKGHGIDVGCGGDKIMPDSIGFDLPNSYIDFKESPIDVRGDARHLPYPDNHFDYLYSSHLFEDFHDVEAYDVIREWIRVVKPGGFIFLYLPIEKKYKEHCAKTGQDYNMSHKSDMSIPHLINILPTNVFLVRDSEHSDYSFYVILIKLGEDDIKRRDSDMR
jgi:ubiquinone/menaquinone biosynthesis C-methylase UbiE